MKRHRLKIIEFIVNFVTRFTAGFTTRLKLASLGIAGLFMVGLLSSCQADSNWSRGGLVEPITVEGERLANFWSGAWTLALVVGGFVMALIIFAVIRYRRRSESDAPRQIRYHVPLEILYTIVPIIIVMSLFYFTVRDQNYVLDESGEESVTVLVEGYKWSWGFSYKDDNVYEAGTPGEVPVLYLPVDEKVRFEVVSSDVIHSFWIPAFIFKIDAIPGRLNTFEATPNRLGTFAGRCAEYCGIDHSRMLFTAKVVERDEYDRQIERLRAKGNIGIFDTGRIVTDAEPDGFGL